MIILALHHTKLDRDLFCDRINSDKRIKMLKAREKAIIKVLNELSRLN
jgi:hypothetical protein